jgi:transposase
MTTSQPDPEYKNLTIRVTESKVSDYLKRILMSYLQLRNLILLLIKRNHEEHLAQPEARPKLFSYLSHPGIMRALLWSQPGGQYKEKLDYLRSYYAHDSMMQEAITLGHGLKDKIIFELMKQVQQSWKSFFALKKKGEHKAREPKAVPLRAISSYSLPVDMECVSFKRKNKIRFLLERGKPFFVHCHHEAILEHLGDFSCVKRMEICLKNGEIYLLFSYKPEPKEMAPDVHFKPEKHAGLDLGVKRLVSVYIDDKDSPSLLIDGQLFSSFNAEYNRKRAALMSSLGPIRQQMAAVEKARRADGYVSVGEIIRTDPSYRDLHRQRAVLEKKLSKLSRKRRGFFDSNFKKLAKRLIERLKQQGVTHLVTSRNIIEKKSIGSELGRVQNQKFYHIPFGQLLDALKLFAEKSGLTLIDSVDEAYTSKTSCLSGDVLRAQNEKIPADLRSEVLQGRRVKRGSYEDAPSGRRIHADINAAVNILRVYYRGERDLERQGLSPVKLSNPRVIKKDALLRLLDRPLVDPCLGGEQAPFGAPRFQVGAQSYS